MTIDKTKFLSDAAQSGMEEAQAELLANNQADIVDKMVSQQDLEGLRRDMNEQTQKTRLLIDDVHRDMRRSEAKLEWRINQGFEMVSHKFNAQTLLRVCNGVLMSPFTKRKIKKYYRGL